MRNSLVIYWNRRFWSFHLSPRCCRSTWDVELASAVCYIFTFCSIWCHCWNCFFLVVCFLLFCLIFLQPQFFFCLVVLIDIVVVFMNVVVLEVSLIKIYIKRLFSLASSCSFNSWKFMKSFKSFRASLIDWNKVGMSLIGRASWVSLEDSSWWLGCTMLTAPFLLVTTGREVPVSMYVVSIPVINLIAQKIMHDLKIASFLSCIQLDSLLLIKPIVPIWMIWGAYLWSDIFTFFQIRYEEILTLGARISRIF